MRVIRFLKVHAILCLIHNEKIKNLNMHYETMFTLYRIVKRTAAETDPVQCEQEQVLRSKNCSISSVPSVNRGPFLYSFCNALFHYPVQFEHSLKRQGKQCHLTLL